jgi:CelD/BcsL family acetyltransferase involved in cellulose biosynthesis
VSITSEARIVVRDPVTDPAWAELVGSDPAATIFHHPAWLRLLKESYRYGLEAWCVQRPDGRLAAGLPVALVRGRVTATRLVAVPFSDACGPLRDPGASVDAGSLAAGLAAHQQRAALPLEVRGALASVPGTAIVERYLQHHLALEPDVEQVTRRFAKSQVKRGIAKAIREGVTVGRHASRDALERFYAMHMSTRRHQGVPTQPKRFIMSFERLFDEGLGFVLLARRAGRDIAAAVFLTTGTTLTYKYGASRRSDLSVRPNNLLFMEAIRWGCEHGMRTLDFGRTDPGHEGLLAFKRSWGAVESPLAYTYLGQAAPSPEPGPPQRAISSLIRHSPPAVGRWVGEALYRELA